MKWKALQDICNTCAQYFEFMSTAAITFNSNHKLSM